MLIIRNPGEDAGNEELGVAGALADGVVPGVEQELSSLIPFGAKVGGTVADGLPAWFAIRTNSVADGIYQFVLCNDSQDTVSLYMTIYDERGNKINTVEAKANGIVASADVSGLTPNTTYLPARDSEYQL